MYFAIFPNCVYSLPFINNGVFPPWEGGGGANQVLDFGNFGNSGNSGKTRFLYTFQGVFPHENLISHLPKSKNNSGNSAKV